MTPEEIDIKAKELVSVRACSSLFEAKKVVTAGKFDKYKEIAARNCVEMASVSLSRKKGTTTWACPKCKDGFLTLRVSRVTKENFLGCTNYPLCKFTQKEEKPDDGLMGVVDAASVWER